MAGETERTGHGERRTYLITLRRTPNTKRKLTVKAEEWTCMIHFVPVLSLELVGADNEQALAR